MFLLFADNILATFIEWLICPLLGYSKGQIAGAHFKALDILIHYNTQTLIYRPRGRGFCNPLPRGLLSKMLFPEKNDFSRKVIVL